MMNQTPSTADTIRQMLADWNAATPAQRVTARIAAAIAAGTDPIDALREVCGADLVDGMIASLYDTFRATAPSKHF